MNLMSCPQCKPDMTDGCYCVQNWPVLGTQALAAGALRAADM